MSKNKAWLNKPLKEKIAIMTKNHERLQQVERRKADRKRLQDEARNRTTESEYIEREPYCSCNSLKTSAEECYSDWVVSDAGFCFNADVIQLKLSCSHGNFEVSLCADMVEGSQVVTNDTIKIDSRLDLFKAQRKHPDRPELAMAAEIWDYLQPHMEHRWLEHNSSPIWSLEAKRI